MKDNVPTLEFNDAIFEQRGRMVPIKLKLSGEGVSYEFVKTRKSESITPDDLKVVNWQRLAGGYGVRIFTENGTLHRFGGFKESDQSKLEKYFKNVSKIPMTDKEYSLKGWNHGFVKFNGESLMFDVNHVTSYEVPLTNVSQCITGKNEITMEFHQSDDAPVALVEMRYHLPPTDNSGEDHVEKFKERVMIKAQVITATGDAMAIFSEIQCLTPRGRYEMKFYPKFIQLHGKTFDFKLPVDTILRLFLLPHLDQRQHFFVVSLDPPIRQGQTRYPYLILLFNNDDEEDIELPMEEDELKEKYEGRLEKEMSGPQFEIISRMFKGVCGRKIVTPGNFIGNTGTSAVGCSYKAAAGYIYPLERGFFYVHKPPLHIRHDEISAINFARSGSTTRSFDFEIQFRDGTINTFSSIEKGEYTKLYDYVTSKKLKIKNKGSHGFLSSKKRTGDAGEPDHYMNRVQAEAEERDEDDDDDSESEDSDFNPNTNPDSDVAEEYDSNAPDTSDENDSDAANKGSPKKKKEAKPKKAKTISEKPRRQRGKKKERDENRPKRPMSAYFFWLGDHREQIKSETPGISITDISKRAGEMWRELTERKEWDEKAAEAKIKYEQAMKVYNESGGAANAESRPKKTKSGGAKSKSVSSPTKERMNIPGGTSGGGGSGSNFKSKEYIEDSDSEDSGNAAAAEEAEDAEDSDDQPLKIATSPKKKESDAEESEAESGEDSDAADASDAGGDSD